VSSPLFGSRHEYFCVGSKRRIELDRVCAIPGIAGFDGHRWQNQLERQLARESCRRSDLALFHFNDLAKRIDAEDRQHWADVLGQFVFVEIIGFGGIEDVFFGSRLSFEAHRRDRHLERGDAFVVDVDDFPLTDQVDFRRCFDFFRLGGLFVEYDFGDLGDLHEVVGERFTHAELEARRVGAHGPRK
jgi:hypothetical protein